MAIGSLQLETGTAAPGFYRRPERIDQLVDFVVQRVLDGVGLDIEVADRWTGDTSID